MKKTKKQLLEEIERIKRERDEYKELYLRKVADFENYKKRMEEDWRKAVEFATERFIFEILPVIDNLERALNMDEKHKATKDFREGISMIYKQFLAVIEKEGVRSFSSKGMPFDPKIHEAISIVETEEYPPNTVVEEYEKGYFLKDKLLRPAKVQVSKESHRTQRAKYKKGG